MGDLEGRRALVSGGASGIGRAIALAFSGAGAAVAVADLDESGARTVSREIHSAGGRSAAIRCDVSAEPDCRRAVEEAAAAFGGLDLLVNCAGIIRRASVLDTTEEEWDRLMAVNVKSVFLLSRHAIPHMISAGGGVIVNISSGWGLTGGRMAAAYCASKAAVVNLTKAMALDHAPQNIRVVCICPGDTDTPMLRHEARQLDRPVEGFLREAADRPLGRIGTPDDIAHAALYLAGDRAAFVTGAVLVVDGGGLAG